MPQLKSGRKVGVSASHLLDKIKFGTDAGVSAAIMAFRLAVSTPEGLRDFLAVAYFRDGDEPPSEATSYNSGFLVKDILEGKAGWSEDEIREFDAWLKTAPRMKVWLKQEFDAINEAIQKSMVWDTPLWTDEDSQKSGKQR